MSFSNGSSEAELENEACGSGSKVSDDSGIEDTWNDENVCSKKSKIMPTENSSEITRTSDDFSFRNFTPLTPPKEENQSYGPPNIYPPVPSYSPVQVIKSDLRDPNAISGVCGIENLGNTCFMNAGLQCLFASPLLHHLVPNDESSGLVVNADNSKAMLLMVDKLQEIFRKAFSGEFSSLYPSEFHNALTQVHAIFGDHKQHDCQEFLSFLLNGLHDALNRMNPRKRAQDSRESSPPLSNLRLETSSESENDDCDNNREDTSKRMRMDNLDVEPDVGVECDGKLTEAQIAWRSYLNQNHSVIVDIFQGQFKSMVTCEKCHHVSNTYEPYMHVSVPIPYSNERQVVLVWHGLPKTYKSSQLKRYLVTVTKNSSVGDVKSELIKTIQKEEHVDSNRVIMAEVSHSTIVRTLVDNMQLKFLNPKNEKQIYAIETHSRNDNPTSGNNSYDPEADIDNSKQTDALYHGNTGAPMDIDHSNNTSFVNNIVTGWHTCGICLEDIFDDDLMIHQVCGGVLCKDCLQATCLYHSGHSFPCPVCNATVDEKTFRPISESNCEEITNRTILVPLFMRCKKEKHFNEDEEASTPLREKTETFGHPYILLLKSKVEASEIHERVQELMKNMPDDLEYSLRLTDSQGVACSRCDTFAECTGCAVITNDVIQLRPGDHLTIHFDRISQHFIDQFSSVTNDESLSALRDSDVIQLSECFRFFSECELLSEENPWFCPKCRRNQVATKGISISKLPDVLIVHLKRFHFEGLRSVKITSPVQFQLENFSLDLVCSAETSAKEDCNYELFSCVCHTGSLTSGHYTSFCKNFTDSKWYHFNDEVTSQASPSEKDYEKVYMLFYQKTANGSTSNNME